MEAGRPAAQEKLREYTIDMMNHLPVPQDYDETISKGEEYIRQL